MKKKSEKAVIAFYDNKKRILLQDRQGITETGDEWGYFGGSIELEETPEKALIREIKEELDFDIKDFELLTTLKYVLPNQELYNKVWLYIGPLDDKYQKMKQKEGRAMKWFTIDEAKQLVIKKAIIKSFDRIEKYLNSK